MNVKLFGLVWYVCVYNIQIFEGLKCSNMFVFRRQYLIEIRTIHLNLISHLGKVCSCRVKMLAQLKCWNKSGICCEYTAVIFGEHFGFILWNIGIFAQILDKLQLANMFFYFVIIKWNNTCSLQINDAIIKWDVKHLEHCKKMASLSFV